MAAKKINGSLRLLEEVGPQLIERAVIQHAISHAAGVAESAAFRRER
jgi:hypothetical protein